MSDAIFEHKKSRYLELRDTFPDAYDKTHTCAQVLACPEGTTGIKCAGRVVGMRVMGKLLFAHIYDITGRVQICVRWSEDNPTLFESFKENVHVGDFVGVEGELFTTKTGELTIRVASYALLNKCLRPLPEKYHGLEDRELRYRQRYLDIICNAESRNVFLKRAQIVRTVRRVLESEGFIEVETPVLQTLQCGAAARPFFTHHNALDIDCVLRIAPETYLKRCIGAGYDKVYEYARCFRNEGISPAHLQDFTMVEFYAAYWNAEKGIKFVEKLFREVVNDVLGDQQKVMIQGKEIDFAQPWPIYDYSELVLQYSGIDIRCIREREALIAACKEKGIYIEDAEKLDWAALVDALYKQCVRPHLVQPCFLIKYPAAMVPLARRNKQDPDFVDKFQFLVNGAELCNAYSELVDPIDQRERFEEQMRARALGNDEAMPLDEDFLLAMEHGFPPICGVGFGIDRLVQVLCGCDNIRDTVLFPLMRPL